MDSIDDHSADTSATAADSRDDGADVPSQSLFLGLLVDPVALGPDETVLAAAHAAEDADQGAGDEGAAALAGITPAAGGDAPALPIPEFAALPAYEFKASTPQASIAIGHDAARSLEDAGLSAFAGGGFAPLARGAEAADAADDDAPARWLFARDETPAPSSGPEADLVPNDPLFGQQWHLNAINVQSVWNDYTGTGVRLGLIDDGVEYTHPDLAANYNSALDYDARNNDTDAFTSSTGDQHGTSVSGTMAAVGQNGIGGTGVAFGAQIVGFRMGFGSNGSISQITTSFQKAIAVDVVNNSWGYSGFFPDNFKSSSFTATANALQNDAINGRGGLGTVIVFAAGNYRTSGDNVDYHGFQDSKYVISVAATDSTNHVASFSNPGAGLLVAAPGVNIVTTDRVGSLGFSSGDSATVSGTSFSAPIVSGVAGLMLEANPSLGARDVQEILAYSAVKVDTTSPRWTTNGADNWNGGGLHFSSDYGFGLVDAHAAVRLAETWTYQHTFGNMVSSTASKATTQAIPDNNATGISQSVTIGSHILIDHVEVDLSINHTAIGDLRVILVSPDGTQSVLVDRPGINPDSPSGAGSTQDNISFNFNSNQFWGEDSAGTWKLIVSDNHAGQTGSLVSWNLTVSGDAVTSDDTYIYTDEYAGFTGAANAARRTLTDSNGGHDTINASAVTSSSFLDLVPGHNSTIAGNTLTIAVGTVIEDAFAGDGNDTVVGNSSDNEIFGGRGNDSLDGGGGNDTALYLGVMAGYSIVVVDATHVTIADIDFSNVNEGTDTLANFEFIQFADTLYALSAGPPNTPPVATTDSPTTNEDNAVTVAVLANDTDANGDTVTVSGAANGAHGTTVVNADGTITYTPAANYNGADSFTYSIDDGHGGTATGTVNVTVNPVNDNPVAGTDGAATPVNTPVTITVLSNDSDVDGDTLTVSNKTNGAHGTVAINANNTVTYTPTAGYTGADSFTYTISDGHGGTATGTVNVTVSAVNVAPVANTDTVTTAEDAALIIAVLANDTDGNNDTLSVTGVSSALHGTAVVNANGTVTYTPSANYNGADSFTYSISDGHGGTATGTVNVTVTPVNDAPVANGDSATTLQNTPVTVSVLSNDTDVDGDTLSVSGTTNPAHGSVVVNGNGTITYTPTAGYTGADSFSYTASDGHGGTSSATVGLTVSPAAPETLLSANFNSGTNGFTYFDDTFLSTNAGTYESGAQGLAIGFGASGGLRVILGGINNSAVSGMSGGWSHDITLSGSEDVTVTFRYDLSPSPNYESNEYSQVMLSVDGTLYGTNGQNYISRISGGGDTGWVTVTLDLGVLSAGTHTLTIGGYNNHKDASNESTTILLDDVTVTGTPVSGSSAVTASAASPLGASEPASAPSDALKLSDVLGNDAGLPHGDPGPGAHSDPGPAAPTESSFTASVQDIVSNLVDEHAVQAVQAACAA